MLQHLSSNPIGTVVVFGGIITLVVIYILTGEARKEGIRKEGRLFRGEE